MDISAVMPLWNFKASWPFTVVAFTMSMDVELMKHRDSKILTPKLFTSLNVQFLMF